jgi:predicted GH43/DUF377 family glycosyl hydrolase
MLTVMAFLVAACNGGAQPTSTSIGPAPLSEAVAPASASTTSVVIDAAATTASPVSRPFGGTLAQVLGPGEARWESLYVDPGAVITVDGVTHMFYNGIHDWPANAAVGHATSSDGIVWERRAAEPLMSAIDVPWVGISMFASDAAILDDGTWAIYFHAIERINSPAGSTIGLATAPGPDGPWTFEPGPVLEPGPPGSWDEIGVLNPSVVQFDGRWWMFYDAQQRDERAWGDRSIGYATSPDGRVWTKGDDPVLSAMGDGWEGERVYDPNVIVAGDGLVMTYLASIDDPNQGVLEFFTGVAASDDGTTWSRYPDNPVSDVRGMGLGAVFVTSAEAVGDGYHLYFDSRAPDLSTRVWVLVHEGPIG